MSELSGTAARSGPFATASRINMALLGPCSTRAPASRLNMATFWPYSTHRISHAPQQGHFLALFHTPHQPRSPTRPLFGLVPLAASASLPNKATFWPCSTRRISLAPQQGHFLALFHPPHQPRASTRPFWGLVPRFPGPSAVAPLRLQEPLTSRSAPPRIAAADRARPAATDCRTRRRRPSCGSCP